MTTKTEINISINIPEENEGTDYELGIAFKPGTNLTPALLSEALASGIISLLDEVAPAKFHERARLMFINDLKLAAAASDDFGAPTREHLDELRLREEALTAVLENPENLDEAALKSLRENLELTKNLIALVEDNGIQDPLEDKTPGINKLMDILLGKNGKDAETSRRALRLPKKLSALKGQFTKGN